MFEELAMSLDSNLDVLDENGFVNTYMALMMNKIASKNAKAYRTALSDLESMLDNNLDRLSIDSLADLQSLYTHFLRGLRESRPNPESKYAKLEVLCAAEIEKLLSDEAERHRLKGNLTTICRLY